MNAKALAILLLLPLAAATPWQIDELQARVTFSGAVDIVPTSVHYSVNWVEGGFYIMPQQTWLQSANLVSIYPENYTIEKDKFGNDYLNFRWENPSETRLQYGVVWDVDVHRLKYVLNASGSLSDEVPEDIKPYLAVDNLTNWTGYMKAKAEAIVAGSNTTLEAVRRLAEWISTAVKYDRSYWEGSLPAQQVFYDRRGVCDEFTNLFIALCKSIGIPARYVEGLVFSGEDWNFHAFAEVYIGDWVPVDPTYNEVGFLDSSHIILANVQSDNDVYNNVRWEGQDLTLSFGEEKSKVDVSNSLPRKLLDLHIAVKEDAIGLEALNVTASLSNLATSKLVATCSISIPVQMLLLDLDEKSILLQPGENAAISWSIATPPDLDKKWLHRMPVVVSCFPGINVTKTVQVDPKSSKAPIARASIVDVTVLNKSNAIVIVKNVGTKVLDGATLSLCLNQTQQCLNQTLDLGLGEAADVMFSDLSVTDGVAVSARLYFGGVEVRSDEITLSNLTSGPPSVSLPAGPANVNTTTPSPENESTFLVVVISVVIIVIASITMVVIRKH